MPKLQLPTTTNQKLHFHYWYVVVSARISTHTAVELNNIEVWIHQHFAIIDWLYFVHILSLTIPNRITYQVAKNKQLCVILFSIEIAIYWIWERHLQWRASKLYKTNTKWCFTFVFPENLIYSTQWHNSNRSCNEPINWKWQQNTYFVCGFFSLKWHKPQGCWVRVAEYVVTYLQDNLTLQYL